MNCKLVIACLLTVLCVGCTGDRHEPPPAAKAPPAATAPAAEAPAAQAPAGWELAYTSDFKGPKLPAEWDVISGEAQLAGGALLLKAADDGDAQMMLKKPRFPGSVRIEFTGSLEGGHVCDLSPFLNANDWTGQGSGYLFQFGGSSNRMCELHRAGEAIESTNVKEPVVTPGRKYRVVAENDDGKIRFLIDGKEVFNYHDFEPLRGSPEHDQVGFYTWGCTLRLEEITIYTPAAKPAAK